MRQHTVHTPYPVGEAHFYSTEIEGELVLFDTGPATPDALLFLRQEIDLSRLRYVFITHCHVDHYGLAHILARETDAEIFIPFKDAVKIRKHHDRLAHIENILEGCGFDAEMRAGLRTIVENVKIFPPFPDRYTVVEESGIPAKLGITWLQCPGHSQSDLVYRYNDWAVTGDILLKGIFQAPLLDIDLETFEGRFRNYDAYCSSLIKLSTLRGSTIFPGHRYILDDVDGTILFYVQKTLERAGQVKKFAHIDSIRDVVDQLFTEPSQDPFFTYLKASEIAFMRDFLADPEKLRRSMLEIGLYGKVADLYEEVLG